MDIKVTYKNHCLELYREIEGGGWVIRGTPGGVFNTYEIPQYGGEELHVGQHSNIFDALDEVLSWL